MSQPFASFPGAPFVPGVNTAFSSTIPRFGLGQNPSPFYSISNQFLPRNFHDVIKWSRYLIVQSPTVVEVIRKMVTYPITDFIVDTENPSTKAKYKEIFKSIKLKVGLQDIGFNYYTLGNSLISMYFPILRLLECPACKTQYQARTAEFISFKKFQFVGTCANCNEKAVFKVVDKKSPDVNGINIVKWSMEHISVNHNPITGDSDFYYKIPREISRKIMMGDKMFVSTVPWSLIEAVKSNQDFLLDKSNVFHLKNISMGSILPGLGLPPLISLYSLVFYQAMLRKANEAIAAEYLTPMRVVFPQAQTANSDPVVSMSMASFSSAVDLAIRKHKQDQNHFLISPVPIGYSNIGGEGKNLLIAQEITQAEQTILLGLGVSQELLSGTTNWTSSTVGLRLLENTMLSYTSQLQECLSWIVSKVAGYLHYELVDVTLAPFKLMDDDALKQNLVGLLEGGKVSISTLFEALNMDYEEELRKIKEDAIKAAENQIELQYEVSKAKFIKSKEVAQGAGDTSGYTSSLEKAHAIAQELIMVDPTSQQNTLMRIKQIDPGLFSQVMDLLQEFSSPNIGVAPDPTDPAAQGLQPAAGSIEEGQVPGENGGPESSGPSDTSTPEAKEKEVKKKS